MKILACVALAALFAYAQADCRCSADDIKTVLRDWESVWGAAFTGRRVAIAQAVFADLFERLPETKELFKRVDGENADSPMFKAHCIRVVNGLDLALNLLNDPATLDSALDHLAAQHAEREGVKQGYFAAMGESFDRVLPQVIPHFNHDTWDSCFDKVAEGIAGGLPA